MSVTSPTSASLRTSLLEWDEAAVQSYLSHIGLSQYEDVIVEHGITGDVLAMMDHSSLQDLGISSVGHRLNLLRAVWELKKEQGIQFEEDDWKPQDAEEEKKVSPASVDRLWDLILEQQDRLMYLERNHDELLKSLERTGISVTLQSMGNPDGKQAAKWRDFGGRQSDGEDLEAGPSKVSRRASQLFPSSLASSTTSTVPAPLSSDSATFQDSFTPTTASASYPFESPSNQIANGAKATTIQPPPFTRLLSGSSLMTTNSPSSNQPSSSLSSLSSTTRNLAPVPGLSNSVSPTPPSNGVVKSDPTSTDRTRARDAARNAAKSFRVTLDDPCYKVLPAALKKYKINDDWRVYALFICFGNTERCLSYDEKPLLLFQKLKETGHKPVFMLRHLRDIKSPVAVAQQKQAIKLGLPPNSTDSVLPQLKPADDSSLSPTKVNSLQPARRDDGSASGGLLPEVPSPGGPNSAGVSYSKVLVDKDGVSHDVSFAVAIYPYIADRQDEFNVAVGACYVIMSKAKGWYIVQRDPNGNGNIVPDQSKSGWVPAGCLLELQAPIAALSAGIPSFDPAYPGLAPLPSSAIVSSSYPGTILMSWVAKADDQASFKEGERVKVYKKYCHWSYTINADTGMRGWIPSWFIGKQGSSSGGESQPGSATTPTALGPGQTPSTGSSGVTANAGEEKDRDDGD